MNTKIIFFIDAKSPLYRLREHPSGMIRAEGEGV